MTSAAALRASTLEAGDRLLLLAEYGAFQAARRVLIGTDTREDE